MKRVLITGAAGKVARLLIPYLQSEYELIFTDAREPKTPLQPFVKAQLEDYSAMLELCRGVDSVLHLGAIAFDAAWESQIAPNIVGVQHVLLAAKAAKCRRVILISSVQAVWGHLHQPILESDAPYPTNFYGASKAFAEALARVHSYDQTLSVICVRLGAVFEPYQMRLDPSNIPYGITAKDLGQLIELCLTTTEHFLMVHGVSAQKGKKLSLTMTRDILGYQPQDDVEKMVKNNWQGEIRWQLARAKSFLVSRAKGFYQKLFSR